MKVTKEFTFDAAHRLPFHDGKCCHWHGHTYKLQVTVEQGLGDRDMLIDFGDVKQAVNERIVDIFDHSMIVGPMDQQDDALMQYLGVDPEICCDGLTTTFTARSTCKVVFLPKESTAENMVLIMAELIADELKRQEYLTGNYSVSARLYETPTSWAETTA